MKKLALLTAAGAALLMAGGVALAQSPDTTGASKSHMGNPPPSGSAKKKNPNAAATDKRNNPNQADPANSSGGTPATRGGDLPKGGKNKSGM
ncbi:MAG: hypothetical protein JO128_21830 [Alphaproteobacteria bacterium]|nr:hypothetical protein [Alphaproteobacteria bacterium]